MDMITDVDTSVIDDNMIARLMYSKKIKGIILYYDGKEYLTKEETIHEQPSSKIGYSF